MNLINTLSIFSGGGGLDLGGSAAGLHIALASDIDYFSCKTLEQNQDKNNYYLKHPILCDDIRNISYSSIKNSLSNKTIDFVIGGPPCQAFSVFGKRKGLDDPRGNLVFEYARLIKEIDPEAFLFENVAGLKTIHSGKLYNDLFGILSIDGKYTINSHEYSFPDYGIPQYRKRVFFIGSKNKKTIPLMPSTHEDRNNLSPQKLPYVTVRNIFNGLPSPITNWKSPAFLNGHVGREHSNRIIERYKSLVFGERDPKTRINKLNPDKPSFTIIVGSDAGGGKGHVHPFEPREVTPRESARIQTFPDWWEFFGTGRHIIRQVGNAVPPLFGALLTGYLIKHIFSIDNELDYFGYINKLKLEYLFNGN